TILMAEPCFAEWKKALLRQDGRKVVTNYGLHPRLGKYHQTICQACKSPLPAEEVDRCPHCGDKRVVRGVNERIKQLADQPTGCHPPHRPPYVEQIPLEFIPGIGSKTKEQLYQAFGTEMNILHRIDEARLAAAVGEAVAKTIVQARTGQLAIFTGGGGFYGKVGKSVDQQDKKKNERSAASTQWRKG
ncbi:endonuclease Q family protein, partial [Frankia sp. Cpl3]|nr:endonuclease Q family protein [Frankia sp. Cpl3]